MLSTLSDQELSECFLETLSPDRAYVYRPVHPRWGASNAGLLVGRGGSLLIDTQMDAPRTRAMLKEMQPLLGNSPIQAVVATHSDLDHTGGVGLIAQDRNPVQFVGSASAAEAIHATRPQSLRALRSGGWLMALAPSRRLRAIGTYLHALFEGYELRGSRPPQPDVTVSHSVGYPHELSIGDRRYQLIPLGNAHSTGDLAVFSPADRIVFGGDVLYSQEMPAGWQTGLDGWIQALDQILDLDAVAYVPGHGPPMARQDVLALRRCLSFLDAELRKEIQAGYSSRVATVRLLRSERFKSSEFSSLANPEHAAILAKGIALGTSHNNATTMSNPQCALALADAGLVQSQIQDHRND